MHTSCNKTENAVKNLGSQLTHRKLTRKLTASSFWSHSSTSQRTHKMGSNCELAVSPPWVCNWHHELAVSYSWDQPISSPCSGISELTAISLLTSRWDIHLSPLGVLRWLTASHLHWRKTVIPLQDAFVLFQRWYNSRDKSCQLRKYICCLLL